jgi:hypothetical protein
MLSLKKRYSFKDPENLRWRLTVRQYLLPPSAFQRETNIIPADPVAPFDMSIDIAVGHKMFS